MTQNPSPLQQYGTLTRQGGFTRDAGQLEVVEALDSLWHALLRQRQRRLLGRIRSRPEPVRGLYIWGGVGRGKTWLMDLFYERLPVQGKLRVHFHRFMQRVHSDLKSQGKVRDPLARVAADWSKKCRVLCLDEFFVSDIADAMLLGGLLEQLFGNGVTLVTTSNIVPEKLYFDGLQRARFLPAIDLINRHTRVIELAGDTDFRLRILEQSEIYLHPLGEQAERVMNQNFERMAAECELVPNIDINGRLFHARRRGDSIIWFDFDELCEKPRGAIDYIEIARAFNTVVLSNVPQLSDTHHDASKRFITMIDEFYDRNVKLLVSAKAPVNELYVGKKLRFEFERTTSRLTEMQSHDYLARPHLP